MDGHLDGSMNFADDDSSPSAREVNYFPSTSDHSRIEYPKFPHENNEIVNGTKVRAMIPLTNDFQQPGERFRSMDKDR